MREDYKSLCSIKTEKEKMWNDKMKGFYNTTKLHDIEAKDEEENLLRDKIKRQTFEQTDF